MGKVKDAAGPKRKKKDRHGDLPTLVLASDAAAHCGIDPDTFRLNYLGAVFTKYARGSGHHAVYKDELALYLDCFEDEAKAIALVMQHRHLMGRLPERR